MGLNCNFNLLVVGEVYKCMKINVFIDELASVLAEMDKSSNNYDFIETSLVRLKCLKDFYGTNWDVPNDWVTIYGEKSRLNSNWHEKIYKAVVIDRIEYCRKKVLLRPLIDGETETKWVTLLQSVMTILTIVIGVLVVIKKIPLGGLTEDALYFLLGIPIALIPIIAAAIVGIINKVRRRKYNVKHPEASFEELIAAKNGSGQAPKRVGMMFPSINIAINNSQCACGCGICQSKK